MDKDNRHNTDEDKQQNMDKNKQLNIDEDKQCNMDEDKQYNIDDDTVKEFPARCPIQLKATDHIATGMSGGIFHNPLCSTEVLKLATSRKAPMVNLRIEKRVHQRLGCRPNLVRCLRTEDYGVHLERAEHYSIRDYYAKGGITTVEERIKWSRDVANVL
jgi:hypothetical protein